MPKPTPRPAAAAIEPQRVERGRALLLAGISEQYTYEAAQKIPAQWQRFATLIGSIPGRIGAASYGVCTGKQDNSGFDYLASVEISDAARLDKNLSVARLPEQRYAIFLHRDNVASIRETFARIWNEWVPAAAQQVEHAPFFERYDENFNPQTGNGGVEIWIPLKN